MHAASARTDAHGAALQADAQGAAAALDRNPTGRAAPSPASHASAGTAGAAGRFLDMLQERPSTAGDAGRADSAQDREPPSEPLARVARTYVVARAVVGVGLLLTLGGLRAAGMSSGPVEGVVGWILLTAYAAQALLLALWRREPHHQPHHQPARGQVPAPLLATIGVDLLAFGLLHASGMAGQFNGLALLVLPVLMAGVLLPRRLALATAAAVTLVLLATAWRGAALGSGSLAQAGLAGMGLFVIAWLAGELSVRLVREERMARGSLALARQQADLNRLVIDEMAEGALVVDTRGRIVAANPAACALLAIRAVDGTNDLRLDQRREWAGLAMLVRQGFGDGRWPDDGQELAWQTVRAQARQVRVRVRPVLQGARAPRAPQDGAAEAGAASAPVGLCLLLIEDVRDARQRLQQEKLAAMGRVSAGLAHEIRNPLAAIAQANALLAEGGPRDDQQRLVAIVTDNVRRLRRVVDDVLEAVPGAVSNTGPVDLAAATARVVDDWRRTVEAEPSVLRVRGIEEPLFVAFDAEHLRRVLVNLLDNAWMHASREPGSMAVEVQAIDAELATLTVVNDGPPISPQAHAHLFEPFFSTRSRGTGLGLYLCRELCQRHGARIAHVPLDARQDTVPGTSSNAPGLASVAGMAGSAQAAGVAGAGEGGSRFVVTFHRMTPQPPDAIDRRRGPR